MISRIRYTALAICFGFMMLVFIWLEFNRKETLAMMIEPAGSALRFVHDDGTPLSNGEKVRVLCYATDTIGSPLSDGMLTIGVNGVATEPVANDCQFVAVLHLLHEQLSGKPGHRLPAYSVYATSWPTGSSQLSSASSDVVILDGAKLALFNVVAALEWQPEPDSPFITELQSGLEQASAYLYDVSEGQMAFGSVAIYANGRHWDSADLRFRSANDYRPSAYVGGIVPERTRYDTGGFYTSTVYAPGTAFFGRHWDGNSADSQPGASWAKQDAYRTIVHEWAHYALFLYDEYVNATGEKSYCTGPDNRNTQTDSTNASIMDYHYTTSEFWHGRTHGLPASCLNAVQYQVHGEADWDALAEWYRIQGVTGLPGGLTPPTTVQPGPSLGVTADLFGRAPGYALYLPVLFGSSTPGTTPDSFKVFVNDNDDAEEAALAKQFYILEGGSREPSRIVYQGKPLSLTNEITLLGIGPTDQPRIHLESYRIVTGGNGNRYTFPPVHLDTPVWLTDEADLVAEGDSWDVSLDVTYELSGSNLTTMTLVLDDPDIEDVTAQICVPDESVGCPREWQKTVSPLTKSVAFTPLPGQDELPLYGMIRVGKQHQGMLVGEMARWFLVGGGVGPAHIGGDASSRDGLVTVDMGTPSPPPKACNRVIIMPAASYDALTVDTLPVGIDYVNGLVGGPYELDILLPNESGSCPGSEPGDRELAEPVILTLFYNQDAIDRLGAVEDELGIFYFSRTDSLWSRVDLNRDEELNWIATELVDRDGIFAIVWLTAPN